MAMNKFMHPRNPYRRRPDFKQLAIDFPEFRKYAKQDLTGKIQFNFKDQGAVWALTKCLLKRDFGLDVEILPDRLVPTLPLRMNYLLWIEDLLSIYKPRKVYGIDIGTGASCIYPLLGAQHFSWNMLGTEIDIESVKCAISNVENNFLNDKIKVKCVTEDIVLNGALEEETIYDFCVCNPPFFSDSEELLMESKSRSKSRHGPRNAPSGIASELLTPGGELVFVARIISDSQILKDKIRIYSVMIGKKSNLRHLKELVRENEDVTSVATSVFCQGRTTRWGLAWTYLPGLDLNQAPHASTKKKALSFAPFLYNLPITPHLNLEILKEKIFAILADFKVETDFEESSDMVMITLKAFENTWVNSRKRRRQQKLLEEQQSGEVAGASKPEDSTQTAAPRLEIVERKDEEVVHSKKPRLDVEPNVGMDIDGDKKSGNLVVNDKMELGSPSAQEGKEGDGQSSSHVGTSSDVKHEQVESSEPILDKMELGSSSVPVGKEEDGQSSVLEQPSKFETSSDVKQEHVDSSGDIPYKMELESSSIPVGKVKDCQSSVLELPSNVKTSSEVKQEQINSSEAIPDKMELDLPANGGTESNKKIELKTLSQTVVKNNPSFEHDEKPKTIPVKPQTSDAKPVDEQRTEYLVASLILKENEEGTEIIIEMYFIEGTGGKDAANQLLTIIKNRLKT